MIQHETSVGILNPVGEIGRLCRAARRDADRRRGLGAGRRGRRRRARRHRHLLLVGEQVPALGLGRVVPVRRARGLAAHRGRRAARLLPGSQPPPPLPRRAAPDAVHAGGVVVLRARDGARRARRAGGRRRARRELYRKRSLRIRRVFADLGFESFTNTGRESHTISTLRLPDGPDGRRALRRREGARLHHLPRQGRARRPLHPDRQHGRALRRDHRRLSGGDRRRRANGARADAPAARPALKSV